MSGELPDDWEVCSLGEVATLIMGQSPPGSTYNTEGQGLPFFQGKKEFRELYPVAERWCSEPKKTAQSGDILISVRAPVGNTNLSPGLCSIGRGLAAIRPQPDVPKRYLLYFLRLTANQLEAQATGTTFKAITGKQLREHPVSLAPSSERRRIVEAIETHFTRLDAAMALLKRVQANLKRYRASVLKAAVEGRLVPTEAELARREGRDYEPASVLLESILKERRRRWEEAALATMKANGKAPKDDKWKAKYKEPKRPDMSALPGLPEGWCWGSLPQLGELNRGKSKHRPRNDQKLYGGEYPFIQTGDVKAASTYIRAHTQTYSELGLQQSRLWPAGTLCITIAANIAETAILGMDACFPDSVVGFLGGASNVLTRYVELFFRTARQNLKRYAPATAQRNINLQTLSALAVPVPPLAEQVRIVAEADSLLSISGNVERVAELSLRRITRLKRSTLSWAFQGRLVQPPAHASSEPACIQAGFASQAVPS